MTEMEWEKATDPRSMLRFLQERSASGRKLRLFACALCRRYLDTTQSIIPISSLPLAEQVADQLASPEEMAQAFARFGGLIASSTDEREPIILGYPHELLVGVIHADPSTAARTLLLAVLALLRRQRGELPWFAEHTGPEAVKRHFAELEFKSKSNVIMGRCLADVFGNPFRPTAIDRSWNSPTVANLAQVTYDDRQLPSGLLDNQRLAVLADALEEAGCDNADILNHLRSGGDHVRGCWAVDLVLGKE